MLFVSLAATILLSTVTLVVAQEYSGLTSRSNADPLIHSLRFGRTDLTYYRAAYFDGKGQVYLACRDYLVVLNSETLEYVAEAVHPVVTCKKNVCPNDFTVLGSLPPDGIFTCGTWDGKPSCCKIPVKDIATRTPSCFMVSDIHQAIVDNESANMVAEGFYFFGGKLGTTRRIARWEHHKTKRAILSANSSGKRSFVEPDASFVAIFHLKPYVHFVYNEKLIEVKGTPRGARLAMICANDKGGRRGQFASKLASFSKTRIECGSKGEVKPVQVVGTVELWRADGTVAPGGFFGAFLTSDKVDLCYYRAEDSFKGPIDSKWTCPAAGDKWETKAAPVPGVYKCSADSNDQHERFLGVCQIRSDALKALPLFQLKNEYSLLSALEMGGGAKGSQVVFFVSKTGKVRMYVVSPAKATCFLLEFNVAQKPEEEPILYIRAAAKDGLFFGSKKSFYKVDLNTICEPFIASKEACLGSGIPFCGWDANKKTCKMPSDGKLGAASGWTQSGFKKCHPKTLLPIGGNWSPWSPDYLCGRDRQPCSSKMECEEKYKEACICNSRRCLVTDLSQCDGRSKQTKLRCKGFSKGPEGRETTKPPTGGKASTKKPAEQSKKRNKSILVYVIIFIVIALLVAIVSVGVLVAYSSKKRKPGPKSSPAGAKSAKGVKGQKPPEAKKQLKSIK